MTNSLAAIALALVATVSGAQAATLVNGSFETPATPIGSFAELSSGSAAIDGWTVGGDGVDWIGSYWQNADGNRSIDLNRRGAGSLSQDINGLVVGRQYDISFALAGNPAGGTKIKTLTVAVGNDTADFDFDTTGNTRTAMGWVMESFRFTADNVTETLSFISTSSGAWGPALDKVSVSQTAPVPLPAAAWLLGGAVAGLAAIRRKA